MYEIYARLRDVKGVRDSDVAKSTGVNKSTFTDWRKGRSKPKDEKLQKIADYFGVSPQYLRTGEPAPVFKVSANGIQASYELLQKMYPDVVMDDRAKEMIALVEKFDQLSDNDKEEIMAMIDLKLNRYKEKESENLA